MNRPARLYMISAPSGAGKTSLVKALLEIRPELVVSVSHTTRKPRPNEAPGREYHFVTKEEFAALVAAGAFLENASVFDNFYGTGRAQVQAHLAAGRNVLLEIDWQGARQVRAALPGCVSVFILPPSRPELEKRLRSRGTDSDAVIARRLSDAATDMSHAPEADFVVVNDRFEEALATLAAIIDGAGAPFRADRPAIQALLPGLTQA